MTPIYLYAVLYIVQHCVQYNLHNDNAHKNDNIHVVYCKLLQHGYTTLFVVLKHRQSHSSFFMSCLQERTKDARITLRISVGSLRLKIETHFIE